MHARLLRRISALALLLLGLGLPSTAAAEAALRIAVLEFTNASTDPSFEPLGKGLQSMLTTDLAAVEAVQLVERARLAEIRGEIDLASELTLVRPAGGVLFVIARPQGATGGPPLAVLRIPSPEFPLAFTIGPENVMIPSMQFAGAISISARLDADGNAMTRGSGDISSATAEGLSPGAEGVRLVLSERG